MTEVNGHSLIRLSARTGEGIDLLRDHLKQSMGFTSNMEGGFLARRRHLQALEQAAQHLVEGKEQLVSAYAGELLAEELRLAQQALSESPANLPQMICWDEFSPASALVNNHGSKDIPQGLKSP
jgi:tRNA modification GTPase